MLLSHAYIYQVLSFLTWIIILASSLVSVFDLIFFLQTIKNNQVALLFRSPSVSPSVAFRRKSKIPADLSNPRSLCSPFCRPPVWPWNTSLASSSTGRHQSNMSWLQYASLKPFLPLYPLGQLRESILPSLWSPISSGQVWWVGWGLWN